MAIPDFQSIMLPLLKFCADGKEHTNREALDALAQEFGLTEEEQKELLPSGQQCVINNRVAWARAHMKMANILENTRRGVFRITRRGKDMLKENPQEINLRFLRKFPEYEAARDKHKENRHQESSSGAEEQETKTPAERLEDAYQTLRENLASEIVAQLKSASPIFFKRWSLRCLSRWATAVPERTLGRPSGGAATKELTASSKKTVSGWT